jgi:coenzyme Q-binding protein COQ10
MLSFLLIFIYILVIINTIKVKEKNNKMIEFKATKILPVKIENLFKIVEDIEKYPEFVPWCLGAKVIERGENTLKAQLSVGTSLLSDTYISHVVLTPPFSIESTCDSGPLKSLKNVWEFKETPQGTQTTLTCTFELSSFFLNALMSRLVKDIGSKMIDAFEKRALEQNS